MKMSPNKQSMVVTYRVLMVGSGHHFCCLVDFSFIYIFSFYFSAVAWQLTLYTMEPLKESLKEGDLLKSVDIHAENLCIFIFNSYWAFLFIVLLCHFYLLITEFKTAKLSRSDILYRQRI